MIKKLQILFFLLILSVGNVFANNYYWVGGSGDWFDLSHWSSTSGGLGNAYGNSPTLNDNVFFNANSFLSAPLSLVSASQSITFHDMTWVSDITNHPKFYCQSNIDISGSITLLNQSIITFDINGSNTTFLSNFTENITYADQNFSTVTFNGNGTWNLVGTNQFYVDALLILIKGTFISNAKPVSCLRFISRPSNQNSPRILNIIGSTITIRSSDTYPLLSWDVENFANSIHVYSSGSTLNFNGVSGVSTIRAGCGLHYNDVNFNIDDGVVLACQDTFRNIRFYRIPSLNPNSKGNILGNSNVFNNVVFEGIGFIGDTTLNLIYSNSTYTNLDNKFNSVDIFHLGRVYGNHNVFNDLLFSTHPSYSGCSYNGNLDDGKLYGNNDTINNLLSFNREGTISGTHNNINLCTFMYDAWILNGSNKFDTINFNRQNLDDCSGCYYTYYRNDTLFLQNDSTQTITGALNLIGSIHCAHTFIKSYPLNQAANLYSIPNLSLDYVGLQNIHASNSLSVSDTARISLDLGGNSNWNFVNIYHEIIIDSIQIKNVHPCYNDANGEVTLFVNGGILPYKYGIWFPYYNSCYSPVTFNNNNTHSGLPKDTYHIRIQDAFECIKDSEVTISGPTEVKINSVIVQNIGCYTDSTGKITVNASGGTGNLSYSLDGYNFQTSPIFDKISLGTGVYSKFDSVYVRDDSLCTATKTYTLTQPHKLLLSFSGIVNNAIKCRGDSTGVVILIVNGGTPKYSFVIIGGNRNDTVKINSSQYDYNDPNSYPIKLLGGHYHCIVTDTNGCVHSTDFEIIEPDSIHISFDISKNKCYGDSTGSISATVTGASPPYQYLWTPGNYTTSTINNLAAGIYKLTVTDTNNCVYFKTDTLFSPLPITIKGRQDSVICYGQSNGSAIIDIDSINGGTAPYTIKWWNNGANIGNGYSLINKPAGVYIDSITDAHNCKIKDSITILQPPPFKTNIKIDTIICYGDSSGKAKVIASGETPPYSYKWESGLSVISTVDSIENVPSGTFRLIITDINGCDTSLFVFIPQHSKINATFQLGSSDCSSSAGSWTKVIASGGIPPYTYNWTGPVIGGGQGTDKITGLTSGKYYITIMDNDSCIHSDSVIISTLSSTITPNNGCAQMNNGSAKVTAIGGSTPYTYLWSTGATIDSVINLAPGLYWIVVTDSIHCTDSNTFVIDTVASLIDNIKKSDARCYGDNNGWAKVTSSGGAQPYFYQWSSLQAFNINAPFYDSIYNLKQGKYYVTINYNVYCNIKDSITIDQPPLLKIKIDSANIKCSEGDSTGWIKAIPIGGTSPYKYSWNTGDSTALIDSLPIGTYIVIVSDSNNCIATDTVKLSKPFLAFLHKDIDCNGDSTGWIKAIPSGGTRPYHYNWTSLQTFNPTTPALTVDSIYNLKVGKYFLTMTDSLDCSLRDSVEITQNDSIKISFDVSPNKCFGDSTASVQATVTGGIRFTNNTYHYLWSNGRTTSRIDSLVAKTYILTVTDSLGCVMIDSITVNQPPKLGDSIIYSNDSCFGDQNGWAKVYPIGGRSPYIFLWSPTSVSPNPYVNQIYNLKAGNYFITITDSSGYCTYLDTVLITQPTELLDSIFSDSVSCFGFLDGRAWVRPSGGTPPYHYLWNDITNSTNDTIFNLTSRYYKVTITDSLGCTKTDSILVKQPTELLVVKDSINVNCHDSLTGFARVTPSGGTTPYTYLWSNGAISNSINNLPFGVYWVIVKDKNYCKADTIFFNITQNTQIAFNAAPDTTVCYNTSAKLRIDNPSGGVFPYQVNWNPPNSGFTPTLTLTTSALTNPTNIFIATLKDSKGCEVKDTLTVKVNPQITITTNGNKTICKKDTVWLNVNVNGGLPFSNNTYHYSWDNCATLSNCFIKNPVANPIVTTTYKVTVTDSSGCTASASITVTVKPLPVPVFSSNVVCFGGTTLFANSSTPPAGYSNSYVWDFNDPPTPSSAINPTHTFTHPGTFSVLLTATDNSLYSCHDTVSHLVIVDSLPTTNFTFNNPCLGQTTQFNNLTSANSASFNSFWKFLDDGTQSIDKNPYHFYPVAGTYPVKLIVTNIKGCTDSVQKNVTVNALPVADFTADSLCFPGCAHILSTSTATMSKIDSLKWYFGDGTETPYDTTKNPVHCYNNAGIYYITLLVTDTNNCLGSKTKELKIIPAPYANFASTRVCFGDTTQFTDLSSSTFDTISSRIWYFGDDSSSTAKNPKHSYGHPGKFIVSLKIINQSNCYDSVAKEVFVDSLPVAHFYADTVCLGNETHFTDSSESHGSPNNSWLWEFGDGNSAYYHNAAYPFDSASTYYTRLIVTNHRGCKDTVEKPVVVYPLPIANFTYTGTCLNDTSYFYSTSVSNAADNNFTYLWTFGDGDSSVLKNPFHIYLLAGSYNVKLKITNSNGCSKDTILKILIHPLPDIHFTYLQSCLHDTTIFNNQTNGNGAFITNWLWKFGDDSTSVLKDPSHLYLTADTFNLQLIAMDQYGCRDTLFAPVAVDSLPIANFVYADTCLSMPTRFTDLSQRQGSDNNNWQWEFGDLIQASYQHPFHTYTDPAIYLYNVKLTVTNAMGCKDDTIRPVIVNPLPQANFNFTGICHKSITQFNSNPATTNIGTTIVSYLWNFGDGIDSISELP
ncbi:MAG: PKD domain-containing protein, partial [Bacteroidales bacterium]